MWTRLVAVALIVFLGTVARAQDQPGVQDTGAFEFRVPKVYVATQGKTIQATVGFEIKNKGELPVKVAIASGPTMHVEDLQFTLYSSGTVTGISFCVAHDLGNCDPRAADFTLLRPGRSLTGNLVLAANPGANRDIGRPKYGRFAGFLYVLEDGKKSWIEPFTISDVEIVIR